MEKPNETMGMIAALLAFLLTILALAFLIECIILPNIEDSIEVPSQSWNW